MASLSVFSPHSHSVLIPQWMSYATGAFLRIQTMTAFFIIISLSLITFRIIKLSEFYEHRRILERVSSPFVSSLIVLKNGMVGLTLILLFVFSLSSPLRAEYSPKQPKCKAQVESR